MKRFLIFYPVSNNMGFDRHTFDCMDDEQIFKEVQKLENYKIYDLSRCDRRGRVLDCSDFVEDYNDEELDGGWWCVLITLDKQNFTIMNNLVKTDELYECCPECERDTVIRNEFTPQVCEHCKTVILPCSLCDCKTCKDCPLEGLR